MKSLEAELVREVSRLAVKLGLGEAASRVWSILLVKDAPLSQEEIAQESGYSLGRVSTCLSMLEKLGMVVIVERKGRKKLYKAVSSVSDVVKRFHKDLVEHYLKPVMEFLLKHFSNISDSKAFSKLLREYEETIKMLEKIEV